MGEVINMDQVPEVGVGRKKKTLEELTNEQSNWLIAEIAKSDAAIAKMTARVAEAKAKGETAEEIARLEGLVKLHTDNKTRLSGLDVSVLAQERFDKQAERFNR